jgi:hypothetical protein
MGTHGVHLTGVFLDWSVGLVVPVRLSLNHMSMVGLTGL